MFMGGELVFKGDEEIFVAQSIISGGKRMS